ncbi:MULTISPECIES: tautomerase family protein [Paraburkholderia]|uniref:tautomerase family protein n=1 Tax=Paraburkholderia TaxID=1822464 RepID=UPI002AB6B9D4|nr:MULTISPECIES: tautomerase family protein [Paraburkholderia]
MPVFHAHIPKGRFSKAQKQAIGNSLNRSLVEGLNIPEGDRFIIISEHDEDELFIDPTFMDMKRSADAMIITVQIGAHRPIEDKRALVAAISRLLQSNVDISPDDVFISLIPVPNENFSFGRGLLQLSESAPRW